MSTESFARENKESTLMRYLAEMTLFKIKGEVLAILMRLSRLAWKML